MPEQNVVVERGTGIPMRDGVVLRGDIYRPATDEPSPVLVTRTPYSKDNPTYISGTSIHPVQAAARHGYAILVQDTRGRFSSDGDVPWRPIECEREDGYDTVEWAAAQPWSTGQVGIFGSSYMGFTTLQAVAAEPPSLVAAASYVTAGNYYDGFVYSGGAFELASIQRWVLGQAFETCQRADLDETQRQQAFERLAWMSANPMEAAAFEPLEDVFGAADVLVPHWRKWLAHPGYDDYWASLDVVSLVATSKVPLLSIGGWYDVLLKGALDIQAAIESADDQRKATSRTIFGPWDHSAYISLRPTQAGDAMFGPHAVAGQPFASPAMIAWFDRWIRPDECAHHDEPRVRYFVIGPNEWRTAASWPPPDATVATWHLGADGALTEAPAVPGAAEFVHDPRSPVPTRGGRHLGYWLPVSAGMADQSDLAERPDVITFTSPALEAPLTLVGRVRLRLHVSGEAPTAHYVAKLVDVRPNGYAGNVADGVAIVTEQTARHVTALTVDLWDCAYVLGAGHRIRVDIAGSSFPRYRADASGGVNRSRQRVHCGEPAPSVLELTVGEPA